MNDTNDALPPNEETQNGLADDTGAIARDYNQGCGPMDFPTERET